MDISDTSDKGSEWILIFTAELDRAEQARHSGNEGMARVCARRAAGAAVSAYLRGIGIPSPGKSAYDHLRYLASLPETDVLVRELANHFIIHITPEHELPVQADLIADARRLAEILHP